MNLNIIFAETPRNILSSKPPSLESRLNNTGIFKTSCGKAEDHQFSARKYNDILSA